MKTLWITGAGGIVGSRLFSEAAKEGSYDRICAFAHAPISPPAELPPSVHWAVLDISDRDALYQAMEGR